MQYNSIHFDSFSRVFDKQKVTICRKNPENTKVFGLYTTRRRAIQILYSRHLLYRWDLLVVDDFTKNQTGVGCCNDGTIALSLWFVHDKQTKIFWTACRENPHKGRYVFTFCQCTINKFLCSACFILLSTIILCFFSV